MIQIGDVATTQPGAFVERRKFGHRSSVHRRSVADKVGLTLIGLYSGGSALDRPGGNKFSIASGMPSWQ
jgi:hypothetical protein